MQGIVATNKKAGLGGHQGPAANTTQGQSYPSPRSSSSPFSRRIFPRCRDRRSPCPPAPGPGPCTGEWSALRDALGLLLLGLQGTRLPAHQSRRAWGLVERWTAQLVDARLAGEAA